MPAAEEQRESLRHVAGGPHARIGYQQGAGEA
jgi:hypothetical protein